MKNSVTLWPTGQVVEVDEKRSLFEQLKAAGVPVKSSCGGCATCALCIVQVKSGAENLNDITFEEKQLLGNVFHITQERLSCQTYVKGPVTVDISNHLETSAKKNKSVVRRTRVEVEQKKNEPAPERKPKEGGFKRPKKFNHRE